MTRPEHWASLDQLRPGDTIVWTSGGQAEERELASTLPLHFPGDEIILRWTDGSGSRVNASVLVRRTRQAVQA